jgi:galactonate dehydratase
MFVGWPTDNINDIWEHAYRSRFYRGGEVLMSAISGLDIALWDLKASLQTCSQRPFVNI